MRPHLKANDTAIPEADISYFLTKNIAIETICCVSPHEITSGGTKIGDTTLFPPTVMLQYHFDMGKIKPYVGAGVNYTVFFDTKGYRSRDTTSLKLDNAWGAVVQAGVDYHLTGNWFANVDFKKLWVGTDYSAPMVACMATSISIRSSSAPALAIASARATLRLSSHLKQSHRKARLRAALFLCAAAGDTETG